jgi:uridine kinase
MERLSVLSEKREATVIAIEGRAASGKSTMADQLATVLEAGVIHMDDFFLPAALRTESRLAEPGGNIHYERFSHEVLPKLRSTAAFEYQMFDCAAMTLGASRFVNASKWRIVEGAYSGHPNFGSYYDFRVFSDVSPTEQLNRIENRNGLDMAKVFAERWIPMEERYFKHFGIPEARDCIV